MDEHTRKLAELSDAVRAAPRRRQHALALALYATLAVLLIDHGVNPVRCLSGQGSDPFAFCWFFGWWPWAVAHHVEPFFTTRIWYPVGVSLLWMTSVPVLSLIGLPVTLLAGPVVTYNLLIIAAPAVCAWFAYLLCRHVTRDLPASLIGGYLFGFSTYELAQDTAALNLAMVFCLPALLLVILRRLDDAISRRRFAGYAALLLIVQFFICLEVFALMFLFGGIAWALALAYLPQRRAVLLRLVADALCAAPWVALAVAPALAAMAQHAGFTHHPDIWPYFFTADLLNLVIPSAGNLFGGPFLSIAKHFNGGMQEQDTYLGWPLILLLLSFAWARGRAPAGRLLLVVGGIFLACGFGPHLWIDGHFSRIVMPWTLFASLPLLDAALPVRFALYTSLVVAIIAAMWIAAPGARRWRIALGVLCCLALLPQPHPWRALPDLRFFAPGRAEAVLGANAHILILPFSINGPSSFWQMENDFGFVQVGGYLGYPPAPAQKYQAVLELFGDVVEPDFARQFMRYAQDAGAQYVVIGPGANPAMSAALATLGWPARRVDEVTILTVAQR